jgi:hypothetical protein
MKLFLARAAILLVLLPVFGLTAYALSHGMPDAIDYFKYDWIMAQIYWPVPLGAFLLLVISISYLSNREKEDRRKMEMEAYRQMDEERENKPRRK